MSNLRRPLAELEAAEEGQKLSELGRGSSGVRNGEYFAPCSLANRCSALGRGNFMRSVCGFMYLGSVQRRIGPSGFMVVNRDYWQHVTLGFCCSLESSLTSHLRQLAPNLVSETHRDASRCEFLRWRGLGNCTLNRTSG